uniref:Thylakoid membrane protein slr0575 n=2 Tax=Oryza punctata TaxID=4537 RepID=A0A0E0LU57_ORYPU
MQVSFGVIGLGVGGTLLSYGFGAYFNLLPGSEWSALMLTYGFPLTIIGMALKARTLPNVTLPCTTYADAFALREKCATPILNQVRSDVTRYRYGDEQHLDEALKRIFQYGLGGGIPRRSAPILQNIREEVTDDGKYSLVLVFEAKALELSDFEKRQAKFTSFFGPGIKAEIGQCGDDLYEVRLISETT